MSNKLSLTDLLNQDTGDPVDVEAARLLESALQRIMDKLGVSQGDPADTQRQLLEREIEIVEVQFPQSPKAEGIYVVQAKTVPIAFISHAYVDGGGCMCLFIHDIDLNQGWELHGKSMNDLRGRGTSQ